jgi:hypothetical protein
MVKMKENVKKISEISKTDICLAIVSHEKRIKRIEKFIEKRIL